MSLGARLKYQREKRKWSQIEVAKKIGITNAVLSNYERDYRDPDTDTLRKLSDLYEVSIDYLVRGEDFHSKAKEILDNPDTQYAARDGEISESEALDRIARILEKQKGRVPGQRQQRPTNK
ncbi:helix-turn-helix domain-containing protein [Cytobacillus horneckiae]|uniref:helix-turn-helix domain-containing protein n=1 Tax=Cytobacillus horneckiae TaxID=549687 RepID=UPI003D9A488E